MFYQITFYMHLSPQAADKEFIQYFVTKTSTKTEI